MSHILEMVQNRLAGLRPGESVEYPATIISEAIMEFHQRLQIWERDNQHLPEAERSHLPSGLADWCQDHGIEWQAYPEEQRTVFTKNQH